MSLCRAYNHVHNHDDLTPADVYLKKQNWLQVEIRHLTTVTAFACARVVVCVAGLFPFVFGAAVRANLSYADLSNAQLNFADLSGDKLDDVYLNGAGLFAVNLSGAIMFSANLSFTNLSGANLSRAT